jgi:hypothetical protein
VQDPVPEPRVVDAVRVRRLDPQLRDLLEGVVVRHGNPDVNLPGPGRNLFDRRRVLELEAAHARRDGVGARGRREEQRRRQQRDADGARQE